MRIFINQNMLIGIDASRAFKKERTGTEEYSFQLIKNLRDKLNDHQVVLYVRFTNIRILRKYEYENELALPKNWKIKNIKWPYLWTQGGLSWEMFLRPVDILFVPSHTIPPIHPKRTVLTVHGLEYEIRPQDYGFFQRKLSRFTVRNSCRWAKKIITVSQNTKKDLVKLYNVPQDKIEVVQNGISSRKISSQKNQKKIRRAVKNICNSKFLFFIGRLEERKNIIGIIRAFEILKEKYQLPHKLVLSGGFGFGKEKILKEIKNINFSQEIILTGYVNEEEKWELLNHANVFVFPTFYEGFGLPVLEAQSVGVPVVASDNSSIPEVTGGAALLIDPLNAEQIAEGIYKIISDENFKKELIRKGFENTQRFSWEKCAAEVSKILKNNLN